MGLPTIDVAASIVCNSDGHVLLAERTKRQISAGFWELPGGKIEIGETPSQAARRELEEEVGIRATELHPWISYDYRFPTRLLRLRFFRAISWTGHPEAREGQRIVWTDPAKLSVAPLMPSNVKIIAGLALPENLYLLDTDPYGGQNATLTHLDAALRDGARLILLRAPLMAPGQRVSLARRAAAIAAGYGARVVLAATGLEAVRAGVAGVHSDIQAIGHETGQPAGGQGYGQGPGQGYGAGNGLLSVCCKSSNDAAQAAMRGADFAVMADAPKQNSATWLRLCPASSGLPLPVYSDISTPGSAPQ